MKRWLVPAAVLAAFPAQFLDAPRLGRQDVGDVLGQQPGRKHRDRTAS